MPGLLGIVEGGTTGVGHEAAFLEVGTTGFVEFSPMAVLASWREALGTSSVRKAFDGRVDPSETEGFFDHFQIRDGILARYFRAEGCYPAFLLRSMVCLKPRAKLYSTPIFQKISHL